MNLGWGKRTLHYNSCPLTHDPFRSLNVNSIHGPVVNPHRTLSEKFIPWAERERRSAGGSSGGSAAAVAAGMCDA
jgi:Asp-tRNA(Asn)/Glu-tRNA(Gln) amidotransferase A subunit family amidase